MHTIYYKLAIKNFDINGRRLGNNNSTEMLIGYDEEKGLAFELLFCTIASFLETCG